MKYKDIIIKKNNNKLSKIGIIGLGYVGMPLCLSFINAGFKVIGFDLEFENLVDKEIIKDQLLYVTKSSIEKKIVPNLVWIICMQLLQMNFPPKANDLKIVSSIMLK